MEKCGPSLKTKNKSSHHGAVEMNLTSNHEVAGSIPGLTQCVKDLALLWLWHRPAATALTRPLAWEPPYALGVALKRKKTKKRKERKTVGQATKNFQVILASDSAGPRPYHLDSSSFLLPRTWFSFSGLYSWVCWLLKVALWKPSAQAFAFLSESPVGRENPPQKLQNRVIGSAWVT